MGGEIIPADARSVDTRGTSWCRRVFASMLVKSILGSTMSEIMDRTPSLAYNNAEQRALEYLVSEPPIDFHAIAVALNDIDPNLQQYDNGHYQQEVRIAKINLELLALAKTYFDTKNYIWSQIQFNAILDNVRPTGNMYLVNLITQAHDNLYY